MTTPLSGSSPYCTPQRFIDAYDLRTVGDLLSDTNTRLISSQILASTVLNELLMEASGWVESACMVAGRYAPADLAALTGNSAQMLAGMVAGIAMFFLWDRRPERLAKMALPAKADMALKQIGALEQGTAIFGILEVTQAGVPNVEFVTPEDIRTRNGVVNQARNLFGNRAMYNVPGS